MDRLSIGGLGDVSQFGHDRTGSLGCGCTAVIVRSIHGRRGSVSSMCSRRSASFSARQRPILHKLADRPLQPEQLPLDVQLLDAHRLSRAGHASTSTGAVPSGSLVVTYRRADGVPGGRSRSTCR